MSAAKDDIIAREREWIEAIRRQDLSTLETILADEYIYTATGHGRWSRQRWLETLPNYEIKEFEFVEIDVQVYGDVAVAFPLLRQTAIALGEPRSGEFLLTDVWVKRDNRWQVTTRSSIMIPQSS